MKNNPVSPIAAQAASLRFLRLPQVREKTGKSASTIYREVQLGRFPKPVKIGPNTSAWLEHEIEQHMREIVEKSRGAA